MFCAYCGKELPDESKFCPNCGASMVAEEKKVEEQPKPAYWDAYGTPHTEQNTSYNIHPGSYNDEYKRYKRRVVPFKAIAGAMNLISLIPMAILALAFIGASAGTEDFGVIAMIDEKFLDTLSACGAVGLISCVLLFILAITGFIAPAKGGVICNLIATLICSAALVWSAMVNSDLGKLIETMGTFGYYDLTFIKELSVGLYVFIFCTAFFQLTSLIMCLIGLAIKKNR